MFKKYIKRNMEIYVNDLLAKSRESKQHKKDLREAYNVL